MPKMIGLINEDASIVTKKFVEDGLSKKQDNITGAASTITSSNLTSNRALVSNDSGKVAVSVVTSTELGYLSGVTSKIQDQLNDKVPSTRTINGQALTSDITIEASLEAISNDEIDTICDQILGENLTQNQIDNLYNELINPTLTVEGVEF